MPPSNQLAKTYGHTHRTAGLVVARGCQELTAQLGWSARLEYSDLVETKGTNMRTLRVLAATAVALLIVSANLGCMSRAISEGIGVVTGASGKVVNIEKAKSLEQYRGFKVDALIVTPGLEAPPTLPVTIREQLLKVAGKKELTPGGTPTLLISGEVINYESADVVDTAIGPLEEVIVRARLMDGESREVLAVANLIARAKSTTAGGEARLSEGVGKALSKWLNKAGVGKEEQDDEQ